MKVKTLLLIISLLTGCTKNELISQNNQVENPGYFSDASKCYQSSVRVEKILVNPTVGVVEIPIGYDANTFVVCMDYSGRPVSRADPTKYLNTSTTCLQHARDAEYPDKSYADCIDRSHLDIEIIPDKPK
ncbi:MAG: hypothetical protein ABL919_03635 [Methylococcales bacterium]